MFENIVAILAAVSALVLIWAKRRREPEVTKKVDRALRLKRKAEKEASAVWREKQDRRFREVERIMDHVLDDIDAVRRMRRKRSKDRNT